MVQINRWARLGLLGLLIGWGTLAPAQAQVSADLKRRYQAAVKLVQAGSYDRAQAELNAIIQRGGPLAPYAHYYYALAAYRQKKPTQARLMLTQLADRFPDWPRQSEADYLMGISQLEEGRLADGVKTLEALTDPTLRADAARAEQAILTRSGSLAELKDLNKTYPTNRSIALALIDRIQRSASDKNDLELSDQLTNRFGVPGVTTSAPTTSGPGSVTPAGSSSTARPGVNPARPGSAATARPARSKGYLNVAVMFPFRLDESGASKRVRSQQYVYDLYNGIGMAKAQLQSEGITVNLFAYDVDNDANRTLELVNSPAFAQTDLIIGPLYVEPNRIVAAYAAQHNIVLVNPIATSSELVAGQPTAFLAQASLSQQAAEAFEQGRRLNSNRRVAIYFGASRKDSLLASAYRTVAEQQRYQVVDFRRMGATAQATAGSLFQPATALSGTATAPATAAVAPVGQVFLASSNDDDGPRLLEALSQRRVAGPLLATASAFDFYQNSVATFTRRDLYLIYPDYIDNTRDFVTAFDEAYLARRNTIPSTFAREGFDMLLFFGRQLARLGPGLTNRVALRSDTDDYLLSGFDYTQSNDNQIVPIVKYDGSRFVKIN
ncbi:hypothetical protein GCM10027578_37880 [Spirosoma luteolum]